MRGKLNGSSCRCSFSERAGECVGEREGDKEESFVALVATLKRAGTGNERRSRIRAFCSLRRRVSSA